MILSKISQFIKSLLGQSENDLTSHTTLHVRTSPPKKALKPNKQKTNPQKPKTKINTNRLIEEIKNNIIYLSGLYEQLNEVPQYESYSIKIYNLKQQSKACLKILFRLNQRAIYYKSTVKMVYEHTKEISSLVNFMA